MKDKINLRFRGLADDADGRPPNIGPMDRAWVDLTADQQADLVALARAWAKRNKEKVK